MALVNDAADIVFANRALALVCGSEPDALVGRSLADALPALAEEVDWSQAARNAIDRGRTLRIARYELGPSLHVDCRLGPLADADVASPLALLTLDDVTEAVGLEARLLRQARTQAIANLGDSVAHEIRNPLNSIHMNMQLLREGLAKDPPDKPRLEKTATTVQREIKRLDGVVRDFVQYSRPPALRLELGSINHVVRAALDLLDAQIQEKDLRVDIDLQSSRPIRMDRDRLQRAIYNVLLNAVQVTGREGSIVCRSRDETRRCLLEIGDDGPGIDPNQSRHIFEIFYTTKAGGTGLGLPIANRIVEEHGGRMAVNSKPGHGATFAFFLPYDGPPSSMDSGPTVAGSNA